MRVPKFKFGVCHVKRSGGGIYTGNVLKSRVYYWGYPTRERMEQEIIPDLIGMSARGRMEVVFPLGIYIYIHRQGLAFPQNRLYVQQVPEYLLSELGRTRKAVYFIDEEHKLYMVDRNGYLMS